MTPYDYDRDDPTFVADLVKSHEAVLRAADWLRGRGHPVEIPPMRIRPTAADMGDYRDDGDLWMQMKFEVKRLKYGFEAREDYPYPTMIVDRCHAYDSKRPKPVAYLLMNQPMTAGFLAMCCLHRFWERKAIDDKKKSRTRDFYVCPVEWLFFVRIEP